MKTIHFLLLAQSLTFTALQAQNQAYNNYDSNEQNYYNNQGQYQNQDQNRNQNSNQTQPLGKPTDDYDASRGQMDPGMKEDRNYHYPDYRHMNYYHDHDK